MSSPFGRSDALFEEIRKRISSKDNASKRQAKQIAQLSRGNRHERRRAEALSRCKAGHRCGDGDCLECRHERRLTIHPQVGVLLMKELKARPEAKLVLISAVDHRDGRARGSLHGFDYHQMLVNFCARAKGIGLDFGLVGADDCYSRGFNGVDPLWMPHMHGAFVTTMTVEEITKGFARAFPKGPGVDTPVDVEIVEDLEDLPAVTTYCFKLETTERNPYLGHFWSKGKWRRRRPNPRAWQRRERAMALSGVPVGDLIVLMGMRRWTKDGVVTVKREPRRKVPSV